MPLENDLRASNTLLSLLFLLILLHDIHTHTQLVATPRYCYISLMNEAFSISLWASAVVLYCISLHSFWWATKWFCCAFAQPYTVITALVCISIRLPGGVEHTHTHKDQNGHIDTAIAIGALHSNWLIDECNRVSLIGSIRSIYELKPIERSTNTHIPSQLDCIEH